MFTSKTLQTNPVLSLIALNFEVPASSTVITAHELGYEIEEEELARELLAELPGHLTDQYIPVVEPEDFEEIYRCFLS